VLSHQELSYRKDIDGLRAVAIILVVLFHYFPTLTQAGFIGVDIFFVISGYLISGIIYSQIATDRFSIIDFYLRRVRRIFPALITVLLTCLGVGWFILLSDEYVHLGKHTLSSALFVSNIVLMTESGYFDIASDLKPLLHLWSLGIEEQFYIVWPLIIMFFWRTKAFLPLVLILTCISFSLNIFLISGHPSETFYLLFTRFWELSLGGILAYAKIRGKCSFSTRINNVVSFCAFLLLAIGLLFIQKKAAYPGWWALCPVVFAVMIIIAGEKAALNKYLLSNKLIVGVGLISYPLYLWHWPLLSITKMVTHAELGYALTAGLLVVAVVFAVITYLVVEQPIRKRKKQQDVIWLMCAMLVTMTIGMLAYLKLLEPLSQKYHLKAITQAIGEWDFPGENFKPFPFEGRNFYIQVTANERQVVYIGDSNMEHYGPRIDELVKNGTKNTKTAVFATQSGCPPIRHVTAQNEPVCKGYIDAALKYAIKPEVDTVVFSAVWYMYLSGTIQPGNYFYEDSDSQRYVLDKGSVGSQKALSEFESMIKELRAQGKKVYVILGSPYSFKLDPQMLVTRKLPALADWHTGFSFFKVNGGGLDETEYMRTLDVAATKEPLIKMSLAHGVQIIDPFPILCPQGMCPALDANGEPIYRDWDHFRPGYIRKNGAFIDQTMQ
jgi:peptidoglycan/LPS O-acetylase OafA/YrhL